MSQIVAGVSTRTCESKLRLQRHHEQTRRGAHTRSDQHDQEGHERDQPRVVNARRPVGACVQLTLRAHTVFYIIRTHESSYTMKRIFITGSADGLGRAAAAALIAGGHAVVLHARSAERAAAFRDLAPRAAGVVVGDLSRADETRSVADQVNAIGRMDAVIHNAGAYNTPGRAPTPEGHPTILAVNALAPYMLTALIERPRRLVYLSSGMHRSGVASLRDIEWVERRWSASQAYSDSKLDVTALAFAVARRWPDVLSNAVDPGWVATKMGGPGAPDDFDEGYRTQTWLAVSDDPDALVSGRYWRHRRPQTPATQATDPRFQDALLGRLAELTGVPALSG